VPAKILFRLFRNVSIKRRLWTISDLRTVFSGCGERSADGEARDERRLRVLQQQQSVAESVAALKAKKVYSEKIRVRGLTGLRTPNTGSARRNHL
jgi:hypothetical protein